MFSKYVLFKKKAPKQKGGCVDTLDTRWIRHCSLQTNNHASNTRLSFLQAGSPTNSVKTLND